MSLRLITLHAPRGPRVRDLLRIHRFSEAGSNFNTSTTVGAPSRYALPPNHRNNQRHGLFTVVSRLTHIRGAYTRTLTTLAQKAQTLQDDNDAGSPVPVQLVSGSV